MLNRTAIMLRFRQPCIDWMFRITNEVVSMESDTERAVYLVPEIHKLHDLDKVLAPIYNELFDQELQGWYVDEHSRPKNLSPKQFKEWFSIEVHSAVVDLGCDALSDDKFEQGPF